MSFAAAAVGQENFSCKIFYRGSWIRILFSCLDFSGNRLAKPTGWWTWSAKWRSFT